MSGKSSFYITKTKLKKIKPNAECCDCGIEIDDYSGQYKWVVYHERLFYCPLCAENEGWCLEE